MIKQLKSQNSENPKVIMKKYEIRYDFFYLRQTKSNTFRLLVLFMRIGRITVH